MWFWADVDRWFGGMPVVSGFAYRVEVRRAGCPTVDAGVRTFRFVVPWSRRVHLEVPPCSALCRAG